MLYSILHRLSKQLLLAFILVLPFGAPAAITDGKFGINQIFDVQYYWSGNTLHASNFIAPYNKNFQTVTVTAGQYFQFFHSTTNPGKYGLKLMNSNGTQHSIVHDYGDITALGSGAIFYIGSGFFGNVITTAQGYNYGSSAQFTNMDTDVTSSDLDNYTYASSTPLGAGQTAQPSAPPPSPPPPTPVYGSSGPTPAQHSQRGNELNQNPSGHNAVVGIAGDDNIVTIQQIGTGGQYASVDIQGNVNTVSVEQTGTNGSRHYLNANVIGNNNDLTLTQSGANKTQFVSVNGANNTLTTTQQGAGSHFLNLDVAGDNHIVGIVQDGAGSHSANVVLGGSQPWNFQLNQNSSTSQNYTLPHGMSDGSTVSGSCAAIGGCNLTINQQ
jgi:hypothetical protein